LSYVNDGDRVLMTNPTYNGMAQRVRLAGGVQVFTNQIEANGWHLDPTDLRRAARGCNVIFYGSPSMPTGIVFGRDETERLAEAAVENDALIVFNGAVDKVLFDGKAVINPATLPGLRERTITVGCVTKNYNMVGWRIGWAVGPRELLKPVHDVHIFNGIMASGYSEAGAAAALSGPRGTSLSQRRPTRAAAMR
jgi:aspartate/methionine/tyrosine aminotransferase